MIFVDRSKHPMPEVLSSTNAARARDQIARLLRDTNVDHLQQLRINFDSTIWHSCIPDLMKLFHGKCAYCETPLSADQPIDIEHFRPKQGAEDQNGERRHLYYAWLAYEWDNLLIACASCNRRRTIEGRRIGKAELFPLDGDRAHVLATLQECRAIERPLLLDPCFDDPSQHLDFQSSGQVIAKTPRGNAAIEILGLNLRKDLVDARQRAWKEVASAVGNLRALATPFGQSESSIARVQELLNPGRPYFAARLSAFRAIQPELVSLIPDAIGDVISRIESTLPTARTAVVMEPPTAAANIDALSLDIVTPPPATPPPPRRALKARRQFSFERIRRIEIRNFKAIESLDLEIPLWTSSEEKFPGALMMLGENATGKSTVLDAVALALLGTDQIANLNLDGKEFLRRTSSGDGATQPRTSASVRLHFEDPGSSVELNIGLDGRFSGNQQPAVVLLGYGPRRFFWRASKHVDAPAERVKSMFDPVATLPNPEEWLLTCADAYFALAVRALRTMLLLREEAFVKRLPEGDVPKTHIVFELDGREELLSGLSEGYKAVIAMGVDIMRELLEFWPDLESAHGIVLIDELDTHLHPRWKMRIADRLRRALPEVQFLASTHDPLCLRGYYHGEVQVLRRNADAGIERVTDLPNVRGLSVQQLLNSEFFGLYSAEDPKVDEGVARYATLATKRDRTADEDAELVREREKVRSTLTVGATEKDRLVQSAISEYLLQSRTAPQADKATLERATVSSMVDLWKQVDTPPGSAP